MPLQYKLYHRLEEEHEDTITSLAFSTHGTFLAVGSLDGKLSLWSTLSGRKLHVVVTGNNAILSIIWMTPSENHLLCGLANGVVISIHIQSDCVTVTGFAAHSSSPVEYLAVVDCVVVTGARSEVFLWSHEGTGTTFLCFCRHAALSWSLANWTQLAQVLPPPSISVNHQSEVIVTSLAWARTKYSERTLLVAYLHHGILLWDAIKAKMVHFVYVKTLVGSMSVSHDGNMLVVSNVTSGFDIYHLNDSSLDGSVLQPSNGMLVPVTFIHEGQAILGGSMCGKVQIWDSTDRSLLGTLIHDAEDVVLSIAAHVESKEDRFLIATGTCSLEGRRGRVQLWHAVEVEDVGEYEFRFVRFRSFLAVKRLKTMIPMELDRSGG
ncbi:WD40-repeat-containing domain protein [Pisolithus albus]|nr:WD40-repeat-containing domain protein [Pisolithus albus]